MNSYKGKGAVRASITPLVHHQANGEQKNHWMRGCE